MAEYLLAAFGILVSVILFVIGYRQTVGAKLERVAAANLELERTLIRRVVLEKHIPSQLDLSRLIEGKARDHRVESVELLSEKQLLNTIYTRITESDLIPPEERDQILSRLSPALSDYEKPAVSDELLKEAAASKDIDRRSNLATLFLGIIASAIGGLVTVLPQFRSLRVPLGLTRLLPSIIGIAFASFAVIALGYVLLRARASQAAPPSKASELSSFVTFEAQVRDLLQRAGYSTVGVVGADSGYDFIAEGGGKKLVVEVKQFPLPRRILRGVTERLRDSAARMGAEAILVTRHRRQQPTKTKSQTRSGS